LDEVDSTIDSVARGVWAYVRRQDIPVVPTVPVLGLIVLISPPLAIRASHVPVVQKVVTPMLCEPIRHFDGIFKAHFIVLGTVIYFPLRSESYSIPVATNMELAIVHDEHVTGGLARGTPNLFRVMGDVE
jgi:hypothetical protein